MEKSPFVAEDSAVTGEMRFIKGKANSLDEDLYLALGERAFLVHFIRWSHNNIGGDITSLHCPGNPGAWKWIIRMVVS